jgi:hypothetical protein
LCYKAHSCLHEVGPCNTKTPCFARKDFCFVFHPPHILRSPSGEPPCVGRSEVI